MITPVPIFVAHPASTLANKFPSGEKERVSVAMPDHILFERPSFYFPHLQPAETLAGTGRDRSILSTTRGTSPTRNEPPHVASMSPRNVTHPTLV